MEGLTPVTVLLNDCIDTKPQGRDGHVGAARRSPQRPWIERKTGPVKKLFSMSEEA